MFPEDAFDRFQVRRLCEIINSGTQPIQNLSVLGRVVEFGGDRKAWAQATLKKGLDAYEAFISKTAGKYSFGDSITMADAFLIP